MLTMLNDYANHLSPEEVVAYQQEGLLLDEQLTVLEDEGTPPCTEGGWCLCIGWDSGVNRLYKDGVNLATASYGRQGEVVIS